VLDRANDALGFDLKRLCLEGPEEELERTDVCQPAILATSAAVVEALKARKGLDPRRFAATAGLSLGEYTALWFAGSLALEDALRLVRRRGEAMQRASTQHPSGMLSLVGATREQAAQLVAAASRDGVLVAANFLGPGSIVLSGANAAIDAAERLAREFDVRRTVRLKVAGAFHSPLMASATEALRAALADVQLRPPAVPFVSNVTGGLLRDPEAIRARLAEQVTRPVLWEESLAALQGAGATGYVEPAPGRVLTGLVKKVHADAPRINVESMEELLAYA
jgi:[acyl-carrier-protein] S-malonyltransferase